MNQSNFLSVQLKPREITAGWIYLFFYLFGLSAILGIILASFGCTTPEAQMQPRFNLLIGGIHFVFIWLIFHHFLISNLRNVLHRFWGYVQAVLLGYALYFVGTTLIQALTVRLSPELINHNNAAFTSLAHTAYYMTLIYTAVLAPVVEETLFRGLIFSALHSRSRIGAYLLSFATFASIHVIAFIGTVPWTDLALSFLQYLPASIALGWSYERADSIWAPITIHIAVNTISMLSLPAL